MPLTLDHGIIILILKFKDNTCINITFVKNIYNILLKVLVWRLYAFLPSIICPNQMGFMEGCTIIDNIFLVQKAMAWTKENNQNLAQFFVDFEKMFDHMD